MRRTAKEGGRIIANLLLEEGIDLTDERAIRKRIAEVCGDNWTGVTTGRGHSEPPQGAHRRGGVGTMRNAAAPVLLMTADVVAVLVVLVIALKVL